MSVYGKRGILVRILYLMTAIVWYLLTFGGRRTGEQVIVLCYHGISADQQEEFRRQMEKIKGRIFRVQDANGTPCPLGDHVPTVCVTFDDAFENLLDHALPVLEQYQIPAEVFAVAGNLGEEPNWAMPAGHPESNVRTMTADQLVALSRHPMMRIGSHTVMHPDLTRVSKEQVRIELTESKRQLESLLGCAVEELALPHGAYDRDILEMAREAGYKRIYTLDPKPAHKQQFAGVIGRFSMQPDAWPMEFELTAAGAYAWLFLFRKWIRCLRRKKDLSVL